MKLRNKNNRASDDAISKEILIKLGQIEKKIETTFPAWLTVKEICEYLRLSPSTIRKLVALGNIPHHRLPTAQGGAIRFNRKQIDLWLLSGDVKPKARTRQTFEAFL